MIARVLVHNRDTWHQDVTRITSDGLYLTLDLETHPTRVHYWLAPADAPAAARILLAATSEDMTALLRDEASTP